jgi:UDPglucose 6-dehydrogenase
MQIAVIGSGYVGLVAAAGFCELGHQVVSIDNDPDKLRGLQQGVIPLYEEHLERLIRRHLGSRLSFSGDLTTAVRGCEVIFIAVGTPAGENGEADLSYVEAVSREVASAITSYKVIVEKSTVPVYTSRWIRRSMLLNGAPANLFDVVSNPEFLREGSAVVDFLYPDRIVIGGDSERAVALVRSIYKGLEDGTYYSDLTDVSPPREFPGTTRIIQTSAASAELIKHASNAFLALKISFINAVASICESVGADVTEVATGIGSDSRIGSQFLQPGIGYGGSCFPKDLTAFRAVAREVGYDFRLLDEVACINDEQRSRFLHKIRKALWTLKGKKLAVLGVSFKGGSDDLRESPALPIIRTLVQEGCLLRIYDPVSTGRARVELNDCPALQFAASPYDAARDSDALIILTDWSEFATLDLEVIRKGLKYPLIIDGRNLYHSQVVAAKGLGYVSVGRPDAFPQDHPAATTEAATYTRSRAVSALK